MRLHHVTFTGIDWKTNLWELQEIQKEYPFVEWGVLLSADWRENGNRFFNPHFLSVFRDSGLHLSAHLCGTMAGYAVHGGWSFVYDNTNWEFDVFKRCQLNVVGRKDNPTTIDAENIPDVLDELIIQQSDTSHCDLWESTQPNEKITLLLDASGGRGIDTPFKILEKASKIGYAGGLNVDNVYNKLTNILTHEKAENFWIDMESGVRTNDWFDTTIVRAVLAEVKRALIDAGEWHELPFID